MRMWTFAVSPCGLAVTDEQFWLMTPRQYTLFRDRWREQRLFFFGMYAGIQATTHNAHFRSDKSDPVFTPEMFMPGYKPPKQSWQQQKEIVRQITAGAGKVSPETLAQMHAGQQTFEERLARAKELQAAGAPPEKVRAVMEGIQ